MSSSAPDAWQLLREFRDPAVPKLNNLRRGSEAGLRVPTTVWIPAAEAQARGVDSSHPLLARGPLIIRSGSPTEDTRTTSNAGQLLSLPVQDPAAFGPALARVVAALPVDENGRPRGAIFVQPLLRAEEAGVAFFDGFYFERSAAAQSNEALTSGQSRGEVTRAFLARDDAWSTWLEQVYAIFGAEAGGDSSLDIEYARVGDGYVLLQVRPALFPVARNPLLSLANHREIMGDLPSPWMVSVMVNASRNAPLFFAAVDPAIAGWDESYAVEMGERGWMNFSFFFRLMDRWGMPRTTVTEGVGGSGAAGADARFLWRRVLAAGPRLLRLQWISLLEIGRAPLAFRELDARIAAASGLAELHAATTAGLSLALRTNFAINGLLSLVNRLRRSFRLPARAQVVTAAMMQEYTSLAGIREETARAAGLDRWLLRYGHRGPLESDLARPRFAEIRQALLQDLRTISPPLQDAPIEISRPSPLLRLFSLLDERREWFRDELMRRWQTLRGRILEEGRRLVRDGRLEDPADVFWLRDSDLAQETPLRDAVAAARQRTAAARAIPLPLTGYYEELQQLLRASASTAPTLPGEAPQSRFSGISLGPGISEGRAVVADDLLELLREVGEGRETLDEGVILVVPALEPSWAVAFPRVGGVVAEIGGELSHASILLRESRKPAIVNCAGILAAVRTGDRIRLDGKRGLVELDRREETGP